MKDDVSVMAPPRPPGRRTRSRVQTFILFVGFWAVILWGYNAVSDRFGWRYVNAASVLLALIFAAVIAFAGPSLGIRRPAALLVGVPIVGWGLMFLVLWRLASLPDRYWSYTIMFPRRWTIGWSLLGVAGVALMIIPIGAAARLTGQRDSREAAIAQELGRGGTIGGLPVRERRALMTFRRGAATLVVEESLVADGRRFSTFWVRPRTAKAGQSRWRVEGGQDLIGGSLCYNDPPNSFCIIKTNENAMSIQVELFNQTAVGGVASDGVGFIWVGPNPQIKAWRSFDADGAQLEQRTL